MTTLLAFFHLASHRATPPARKTPRSAGYDVAASEDVVILPGQIRLVHTDLVLKAPEGHFYLLIPRSSLPKRGVMLANSVGVIDEDYCGERDTLKFALLNFTSEPVHIEAGERLVQAVFLPRLDVELQPFVPEPVNRGGFGSTGRT